RESRFSSAVGVGEEGVGIQHLVAQKLVRAAVKVVASGFGGYVDHTARVTAEFRAVTVGLHAELGNCVRTRHQDREVTYAGIRRDAIEIGGALVRDAAANLIISGGEHVLSREGVAFGAPLRHHSGNQSNQIQDVASV